MEKKFEIPELIVVLFEDEMATDNIANSGTGNPFGGEEGDEYIYPRP